MMRAYAKGLIPVNSEICDRMYINDMDKVSPGIAGFLQDSEVREIIAAYQDSKDILLRDKLIYTFSRYIVSIAKNYQNQGLPLCDLISEGTLGLIAAIENFDLENDTQFMTYANVPISRQMREALDQFNLPVKVPKNIRNQHRKVRNKVETMQLQGKEEGDIQDRFLDNEVDLEYYRNPSLFSKLNVGFSLGDDEQESDIDYMFVETISPEAKTTRLDLKKDINRILKRRLTKIEARVLRLYFGIDQPYPMISTNDLGKKLGMSGENARQIKERGLEKLRSEDCRKILLKYFEN